MLKFITPKYLAPLFIIPSLVHALSLSEAIVQTIETNPQISVKKEELLKQKATLSGVKADYLPTVDLSYSVGYERTHTTGNKLLDTANNNGGLQNNTRQEASANIRENLFRGLDTMYGVNQQKALILSSGQDVKKSANAMALQTVNAYTDILRTKEFLEIAQNNMEVHKKYLAQIKEKVNAGAGRNSDYKQTLSRFENARSSLYLAEQNYKNAITTFQRLLPVKADATELEKPTIDKLPATTLEELIQIAMKNNPDIHVSQADIQYAESTLKKSYATYYPTVDLEANAYWDQGLNGVRIDPDTQDRANILLLVKYNLFNGLSDKSLIQANQHSLLKQNSTLADTKRYVTAYTTIAFQTYNSAAIRLKYIEKNIVATAETVADYQEEHDLGRRSLVDLLNIELEYNNAKNRKVTAEYDRIIAYYQILAYTGKMLEAMHVTIEQ